MDEPIVVYTIGHSNVGITTFLAQLRRHEIAVLVDVRSAPYSRYTPQFNRKELAAQMKEDGIVYTFAGNALGGRPTDPTCYKRGVVPNGDANFLKEVDYDVVAQQPWFQHGITRLLEIAGKQRTAIMCSEANPLDCHRHHLITPILLKRNVHIWHIREYLADEVYLIGPDDVVRQASLF